MYIQYYIYIRRCDSYYCVPSLPLPPPTIKKYKKMNAIQGAYDSITHIISNVLCIVYHILPESYTSCGIWLGLVWL